MPRPRKPPSQVLSRPPDRCVGPVAVVWEDIRGVVPGNGGVAEVRASAGQNGGRPPEIEGATILSLGYIASRSKHYIILVNHWCPQDGEWWYWDRIPTPNVTAITLMGRKETFTDWRKL